MIVSLVLVLVALVVAFNFEKLTGQATKKVESVTKVYLSTDPDIADQGALVVNKGDTVYLTVDAGARGSSGTVVLYNMNAAKERRVKTMDLVGCGSSCKVGTLGTAKVGMYYNWEGRYCVRVKDSGTGKDVQNCFTVR